MATQTHMPEMDAITKDSTDNGDRVVNNTADATERDVFLIQNNSSNVRVMDSDCEAEGRRKRQNENSAVRKIQKQLNGKVFGEIKLWMVLILLVILIVLVIIISLALCTAFHEDEDDKFDPSLFTVPYYFNGSFQMSNFSSTPSQAPVLQGKLVDLYRSSPALGRYFSTAEINYVGNDTGVMRYNLMFVLPEKQQEALKKFTMSREIVYNVFRQFLYDQDPVELGVMHIDPVSLEMSSNN